MSEHLHNLYAIDHFVQPKRIEIFTFNYYYIKESVSKVPTALGQYLSENISSKVCLFLLANKYSHKLEKANEQSH